VFRRVGPSPDAAKLWTDELSMRLVVVTDIYGKTKFLKESLTYLSAKYEVIEIIDPYGSNEIHFNNEEEAYSYFQEYIGLNDYIKKLYTCLKDKPFQEYHLLGFSVGASAVWAISQMLEFNQSTKGICFYGSQIRNFLQVNPKIEIDHYFPKSEPHFSVDEVIGVLNKKVNVNCFKTPFLHGFMNKKSKNYNEGGHLKYLKILSEYKSYGE
jgi:dienelactone hydrolase